MSGVSNPYRYQYETVAASQTDQVLGGTGAIGDYLHRILISIVTSGANSGVTVYDNTVAILVFPASVATGVYSLEINALSTSGAWKVTTGSAVTVVGVGIFSA